MRIKASIHRLGHTGAATVSSRLGGSCPANSRYEHPAPPERIDYLGHKEAVEQDMAERRHVEEEFVKAHPNPPDLNLIN